MRWRLAIAMTVLLVGGQWPLQAGASQSRPSTLAAAQTANGGSGGNYTPLEPFRVLDTRLTSQRIGQEAVLEVQVTGVSGPGGRQVPPGAAAVVLNVTAVAPSSASYLTVYPAGAQRPLASNLNFVAGQNIANLVSVKLSQAGRVAAYNASGSVDAVFDVQGWISAAGSAGAGRFQALAQPQRLLDTRVTGQHLGPQATLAVPVLGHGGLPGSGISAIVVNLMAVAGSTSSYLSAFPSGGDRPLVSNLNFPPGRNLANRAVVKVGADGAIDLFNDLGVVDAVVDASGYFTDGSHPDEGDLFVTSSPFRILDTRQQGSRLGPHDSLQLTVPSDQARAVTLNVTAINATGGSFLTIYPDDGSQRPLASDINVNPGENLPNLVVVKLGPGDHVRIYNELNSVDVAVDLSGWFGGVALPDWPAYTVTPYDRVPDFAAHPNIWSVASGPWSAPGTWSLNRVPSARDVVGIETGTDVAYDVTSDAALKALSVHPGGALRFSTDLNTRMVVGTLEVMPTANLEIGTPESPVQPAFKAELVIADQPLDRDLDPDQYGTGLLVFGRIRTAGAVKTPTFARLAQEAQAGNNLLTADQALNSWNAGDRVALPMTSIFYGAGQDDETERRSLRTDSAGGSLALDSGLSNGHLGARDAAGALTFLPHIANLTRNVVIRSQNPNGTRGHTFFTTRADVDLRYTAFQDLGRTKPGPLDPLTNHIGRYAVHLHHLWGNYPATGPYQYQLIGDVVDGAMKWGIAVHDTHFGLVRDNVVFHVLRAGIVTEDGSETKNLFEHNFVLDTVGGYGSGGDGFWLMGSNSYLVNNTVAASFYMDTPDQTELAGSGFYSPTNADPDNRVRVKVPLVPGADMTSNDPALVQSVLFNSENLLQFDDNESYGVFSGFWVDHRFAALPFPVNHYHAWQAAFTALNFYGGSGILVDGLIARGAGVLALDTSTVAVIRNSDIQGASRAGIEDGRSVESPSTALTVENTRLVNDIDVIFSISTFLAVDRADDNVHRLVLSNVTFGAPPGKPLRAIQMEFANPTGGPSLVPVLLNDVSVVNYNGGDQSFHVYFLEQHPDAIVPWEGDIHPPPDDPGAFIVASPVPGLTNIQAMQRYGIAIAGAITPCLSSRPEIRGYTC